MGAEVRLIDGEVLTKEQTETIYNADSDGDERDNLDNDDNETVISVSMVDGDVEGTTVEEILNPIQMTLHIKWPLKPHRNPKR